MSFSAGFYFGEGMIHTDVCAVFMTADVAPKNYFMLGGTING